MHDAGLDVSTDAGVDGAPEDAADAATGQLTPDPDDPANPPCSGVLGFPSPPSVEHRLSKHTLADVTGDGHADLVIRATDELAIARGRGDGTFMSPTTSFLSGSGVIGVGDIDGDGDRDLVFARSGASTALFVKRNDGAGVFGAEQQIDTGNASDQLEVVDLDGDGDGDVVSLSNTSVAVLLSQGASFSSAQVYEASATVDATRIAIGDLTNDARPDLVVSNAVEGTVSVFLNSGGGAFESRISYPADDVPAGIAIADIDGDGARDVVIGTSTTIQTGIRGRITTLRNLGMGVLGTPTSFDVNDGNSPRAIAMGDMDADGHPDAAVVIDGSRNVYVLRGSASGAFSSRLDLAAADVHDVLARDVDGDARLDLILYDGRHVIVHRNTGANDLFDARIRVDLGGPVANVRGVRVLDLDDDTRPDLVGFGSEHLGRVTAKIRLATATGFAATTSVATEIDGLTSIGDLDNDGRRDVVVWGATGSNAAAQALLSHGDGTLTARPPVVLPNHGMTDVILADADGNGFRDVIVGTLGPFPAYASTVHFHSGLGDGTFSPMVGSAWSGVGLRSFAVADLDQDGQIDIVVSHASGQSVLLGTGAGSFSAPLFVQDSGLGAVRAIRDVTGDGHVDLLGDGVDSELVVLPGTGTGSFGVAIVSGASTMSRPRFADLDGDGTLDVVGHVSAVEIRLGSGTGTYGTSFSFPADGFIQNVEVADIDQDGRLDLVVNDGFDSVTVLHGRCL
jgi:hypothetical protein